MLTLNILSFKYTIISLLSIDIDVVDIVVQPSIMSNFCSPKDCNTQGFPVLHHLLEFAQTHVHWVGDTIQQSHLLSLPRFSSCLQYFPALESFLKSLLFHPVAKILELQHQSFQWIFRVDFIYDLLIWSCCPRDSKIWDIEIYTAKFQKSSPALHFEGINSSALSLFNCPVLTPVQEYWENHSFDYADLCRQSNVSAF